MNNKSNREQDSHELIDSHEPKDSQNQTQTQTSQASEELDLQSMWQSIETQSTKSAQELAMMAKKVKRKNQLSYLWDLCGCVVIAGAMGHAIYKQASVLIILWLGLGTVFGIWLSVQFNKFRLAGQQALSGSTMNYQHYLVEKAQSDIKIGRLLNHSNWLVVLSMAVVLGIEYWVFDRAMFKTVETALFVLVWTTFWMAAIFGYGYWKIKRGKKALATLKKTA